MDPNLFLNNLEGGTITEVVFLLIVNISLIA